MGINRETSSYTVEEKKHLKTLFKEGVSYCQMAKITQRSTGGIIAFLKREGLTRPKRTKNTLHAPSVIKDFVERRLSIKKVAAIHKVDTTKIRKLLLKHKIDVKKITLENTQNRLKKNKIQQERIQSPLYIRSSGTVSIKNIKFQVQASPDQWEKLPQKGQCKFPTGTKPPYDFCQAQAIEGKSYCENHRNLCSSRKII